MLYLGIDNGNYNTKSSDGILYSSGLVASTQPPAGDAEYIKLNDTYYSVGARRAAVQYDKTVNDDAWILTLPLIAMAMLKKGVTESDIALGVGLPLAAYGAQRDAMQRYFRERPVTRFSFREKEFQVSICECRVYPQGYSAYLTQYDSLTKHKTINHIDIGGYTVDIFKTQNSKLTPGSTASIPQGIVTMMRAIQAELFRDGILLDEEQITDYLTGNPIEHRAAERAAGIIKAGRDVYVKDLVNTLREHGIDAQSPTNFIGGGAELLMDALRDRMYVVGAADIFANARGYKLWLERDV